MNTVRAAAEGCNELMMHSQLDAPSVYSRTRRRPVDSLKRKKSRSAFGRYAALSRLELIESICRTGPHA